jgi:hypothetical protein
MPSKSFAISALLGLLAVLPVKAVEIPVTVGGPGGVVKYTPPSVVGCLYYLGFCLLTSNYQLDCQRRGCRRLQLYAEESQRNAVYLPAALYSSSWRL